MYPCTGQSSVCDGYGIFNQCQTGKHLSHCSFCTGNRIILYFRKATAYFQQAFPKYDELNASVQENVSAIRVVKAYVREDHETTKFHTASQNIYKIFVKAESIITFNAPLMQLTVYACILGLSWIGAHMIVRSTLTTGELMSLLTYCMSILMSLMMLSMVFVMISMVWQVQSVSQKFK